jgi:hypothetical protein
MMSISVGGRESYPGQSFSVPGLLYAAKKKLRDFALDRRCVRRSHDVQGAQTRVQQYRDRNEPGRGDAKREVPTVHCD